MKQSTVFTERVKRLIAIIVFAVAAGSGMVALADNGNTGLEPIYQTGRKWIWVIRDECCDNHSEVHYIDKVVGDSIMPDGRIVKVIERDDGITYLAYENEEGVFIKNLETNEFPYEEPAFIKRMTFNVEVGDRYPWSTVTAIENLTFLNHTRKTVFFSASSDEQSVCWIEGIGCPTFFPLIEPMPIVLPTGGWSLRLYECWQDDELIYSEAAFKEATSMKEIVDGQEADNSHVYDLFGRKIADPQPGTVYIRNGRKFVQSR
ncbi:MAG: hypothetical protein K2M37_00835 [Muribaculaceae bacterium]|nr:hypothetical protein [Muribaculaceae bacterium]